MNCAWQVAGELRHLRQHWLKCLHAVGRLNLHPAHRVGTLCCSCSSGLHQLINSFTQTCPTRSTLWYPESQKGILPVYIGLGIPRLLLDNHKPEDLHAEAEEDVKHNREQQWR